MVTEEPENDSTEKIIEGGNINNANSDNSNDGDKHDIDKKLNQKKYSNDNDISKLKQFFQQKIDCISHNSIQALSALANVLLTVFLIIFAFLSWKEANRLNELQYNVSKLQFKQYVAENTPVINTGVSKTNISIQDKYASLLITVHNTGGGYVKNLTNTCYLFFVDTVNIDRFNVEYRISRVHETSSLSSGSPVIYNFNTNNEKSIKLIKEYKGSDNKYIILVVQNEYSIPEELSLDGILEKDSAIDMFVWVNHVKRFENITNEWRSELLDYLDNQELIIQSSN